MFAPMIPSFDSRRVRCCAPRDRDRRERSYTVDDSPPARQPPVCCGWRAWPTATLPTRCAAACSSSTPRTCRRSTRRTPTTTTNSKVFACGRRPASKSAPSPRFCTPRPANCWPSSASQAPRVAGAVRQRHRHVGVAGGRRRRDRSARWPPGSGELRARRYENRRRDDLPVVSGSTATIVAGQGNRVGSGPARRARSSAVDARRASLGRRLAVRRRPGDGDEGAGLG